MALGVPQVVPDIEGYSEYCSVEHSMMVKPKMRLYLPNGLGQTQLVDPEDVSKAMERYVFDEDTRKLHARLGVAAASQYSWEKSVGVLVKRLQAIQEDDE